MYNDEQDDNKTQNQTPQPDPIISSGAYVEKDPDEWTTGTDSKKNSGKTSEKPADEAGKAAKENLKQENVPTTEQKITGSNTEKDPDEWVTGAEPMTGAQKSYLKTLSDEAGEEFDDTLSKAAASKRIDELQHKTGRGLKNN